MKEKLEQLTEQEKEDLKNRVKTYMGYRNEISDLRDSMREQVDAAASEIKTLSKKDVKKIFAFFRKQVTAAELREDADTLEEINSLLA